MQPQDRGRINREGISLATYVMSDIHGCYTAMQELLKKAGFAVTQIIEDGMYKIQCGYFSGKSNANRLRDQLIAKGFGAFVKEV